MSPRDEQEARARLAEREARPWPGQACYPVRPRLAEALSIALCMRVDPWMPGASPDAYVVTPLAGRPGAWPPIQRVGRRGIREPRACWEAMAGAGLISYDWIDDPRRRFAEPWAGVWYSQDGGLSVPARGHVARRLPPLAPGAYVQAVRLFGMSEELATASVERLRFGTRWDCPLGDDAGGLNPRRTWTLWRARAALPHPPSVALCVALAADAQGVLAAEEIMRENDRHWSAGGPWVTESPPPDVVSWELIDFAQARAHVASGPGIPNTPGPAALARAGYLWLGTTVTEPRAADVRIRLACPALYDPLPRPLPAGRRA